jgi:Pectate lyase superfamily protein
MIDTPIFRGRLQSDLDFAGHTATNLPGWPPSGGSGGLPPGWRSVKDAPYNAAGNGTTDDAAAIQAAINDCWNAGGGTVYLPPGKYLCNQILDSNSHSILRIPFIAYGGGTNTPSVELRGAFPVSWWLSGLDNATYQETKIVTTRTDGVAANGDALFACGPFISGDFPSDYFTGMNWSRLTIRNIRFVLPANPTFYGLRLDSMSMAHVEDCVVSTTDVTVQPTHGTVGIRMPASLNYAINFLYRTMVCGFGTGVKTGEHFRSNCCYLSRNKTGLEFTGALQASFVDGIAIDSSPCFIRFTGYHQVFVKVSFERIAAANGFGWMNTPVGGDIIDSGYMGTGQILYKINDDETGRAADDISVTGGGYLSLIDLYQPSTRPLATRYMIKGPLTGTVGVPSADFTLSLPVSTCTGGAGVTITPNDGGLGGTFTPASVVLRLAPVTFKYTGVSTGVKQILCTNNGGLINPLQYGITLS